jgi:hypothetical protein
MMFVEANVRNGSKADIDQMENFFPTAADLCLRLDDAAQASSAHWHRSESHSADQVQEAGSTAVSTVRARTL